MKFVSRPRYSKGSTHRIISPEETCRRVAPHMRKIGVTRVADTTGLDILGMPIYSAIRPTDAGLDGISVYNGKGLTKADSHAGAMMEAIERYRAETWLGATYEGTYPEILDRTDLESVSVMDPAAMRLQQRLSYDHEMALRWCDGWDLFKDRPALIPLNFVLCPYDGPGEDVWISSSNGLASGNCIEEAVCHALAELIERDAYTTAIVRAQIAPRFEHAMQRLLSGDQVPEPSVDDSIYPSIDLESVPAPVSRLVRSAQRSGLEVWLRDMTSDVGIPSFVGSMRGWDDDGDEFPAGGFGCDPNATIAAIRAITEAAQGRNVRIQGAREDASAVKAKSSQAERVLWWLCQVDLAPP